MSDISDSGTLIVRAVFVPEGEEPPPDLAANFDTLHFSVTFDPASGLLTGAEPGASFDGDVRAEWVPDGNTSE